MSKMFPTQKDKMIQTSSLKCFYCTIFTGQKKINPQAVRTVNIIFAASPGSLGLCEMELMQKQKVAKAKTYSLETMPKTYSSKTKNQIS